jgi:hypothetical protein
MSEYVLSFIDKESRESCVPFCEQASQYNYMEPSSEI